MRKTIEFRSNDPDYWAKRIGATMLVKVPDLETEAAEYNPFKTEDKMIKAILRMTEIDMKNDPESFKM